MTTDVGENIDTPDILVCRYGCCYPLVYVLFVHLINVDIDTRNVHIGRSLYVATKKARPRNAFDESTTLAGVVNPQRGR